MKKHPPTTLRSKTIPIVFAMFAFPLLAGCGTSNAETSDQGKQVQRANAVEVEVAPVQSAKLAPERAFTGNLLPRRVTRISPEIDGIVRNIPQVGTRFDVSLNGKQYSEQLAISIGQPVKQGDVLVQLDTRDLEIALSLAQAKLRKAQADLAKLQSWDRPEEVRRLTALRDESQARHNLAQSNLDRAEQLREKNVLTDTEFEQSTMEVATTKALLESAEATLATATAGPTPEELSVQQALIAQAEAEVQQATAQLDKATIRAPFDGVVTSIDAEVGDRVSAATGPLLELMDLRYLVAEIGIPEAFIGRVNVHDEARVTLAGIAEPVPGIVIAINDYVDPAARTFPARVAIDNEAMKFKAGQFASVRLQLADAQNANLVVPNASLIFVEGQPHVFRLTDDHASLTPVELGLTDAEYTEVTQGLSEQDLVIVDDPSLLVDGTKVSVRNAADKVASRPTGEAQTH